MDHEDAAFVCRHEGPHGRSALTVEGAGEAWLLRAESPFGTETIRFDGAEQVRGFARAVLDLPPRAEPYEYELELSRTDDAGRTHLATLLIGREASDGFQPYIQYQSFYETGAATGLGMSVDCEELDAERLHAEARGLLRACPEPDRAHPSPGA
ncbi:hypothetical protein ABZY31_11070 [Streptomyces sp. NPDC006529]|uniref:hypothetical protein n=1 Tax=Streptomyces sp. NPDC006529 TaxID=3157177 RepID=UPI0033B056C3